MNLKVGDVVHVRGKILEVFATSAYVKFNPANNADVNVIQIPNYDIVHVEPRPIKAGDKVIFGASIGEVIYIHNELVWLQFEDGAGIVNSQIVYLNSLKPITK